MFCLWWHTVSQKQKWSPQNLNFRIENFLKRPELGKSTRRYASYNSEKCWKRRPTISMMTNTFFDDKSILFLKSRRGLLKIWIYGLKKSKFLLRPGLGKSTRRYMFHTIQTKRLKKRPKQKTFWLKFLSNMVSVVHLHANVTLSRRSIFSKQINRGEDKPPSYTWPAWWLCNKRLNLRFKFWHFCQRKLDQRSAAQTKYSYAR